MNKSRRARIGTLGFLLAAGLLISAGAAAAQTPESDHVSQLLSVAKNQAFQLRSDVSTMDFFAASTSVWEGRGSIVGLYREHIGAMQRQAAGLEQARNTATALQKTVIDRIVPLLTEFASSTDALIARVSKNPNRLRAAESRDYFKANSELATELTALIGNFVDYAQTKQKLERLSQKLELSSEAAVGSADLPDIHTPAAGSLDRR